MSLISAGASVDLSPLDDTVRVVAEAEGRMTKLQRQRVPASRERVRKLSASPEDFPALPFIWSSDPAAQKRAAAYYFAVVVPKNGGKGGRYKRTGKLAKSVTVRFVKQPVGGEFQFERDSGAWDYVHGEKQVPSHYLTGHALEDDILNTEANTLMPQIESDWYFVSTGERG